MSEPASSPRAQASKTRVLVECAMLVALACVLSVFPKFDILPYGGSITFCSMLPIILVSYRQGRKWGLLSGLVFAVFQILTGFVAAGLSGLAVAVEIVFDYLLAFTVLGVGGLFRGKFGKPAKELVLGSVVAISLRFLCHFIAGFLVWGEYAEWFFGQLGGFGQQVLGGMSGLGLAMFYSLCYNLTYILPEMIITCIVAAVLSRYALVSMD